MFEDVQSSLQIELLDYSRALYEIYPASLFETVVTILSNEFLIILEFFVSIKWFVSLSIFFLWNLRDVFF